MVVQTSPRFTNTSESRRDVMIGAPTFLNCEVKNRKKSIYNTKFNNLRSCSLKISNLLLITIYIGNMVATLVARQTSEAEVPDSNPASPTMILGRCRIIG